METFKINHEYHCWLRRSIEEPEQMRKEGYSEQFIQEVKDGHKQRAEKALAADNLEWAAITVLYSFAHGLTGESMHLVRIDTVFLSVLDCKLHSKSEHKVITDAELQNVKKDIV